MTFSQCIQKQFKEEHGRSVTNGQPGADGDFVIYTDRHYVEKLEKELDHYHRLCCDYQKTFRIRQARCEEKCSESCVDELAMDQDF